MTVSCVWYLLALRGVLRTRGCKARDKLHEKLVACGYNCRDGAYSVSLFCDRHNKWHPEVFCGCLLYTSPSPRDRG